MNNLQILRWRKDESPSSGHTLFVNISFIMSMLLNLLMLTGCSTTSSLFSAPQQQQFEIKSTANDLNSGRISLFLNLKNAPARHGIHMQVSKIEILNETTWLPIAIKIQDINAEKIDKHQLFLGRGQLPTGNYHRLRFTLSQQASSLRDDGKRILLNVKSPIVEINLPSVLDLNQGDSHSLFVTWDEANSLPSPPFLQPAWSISPNKKQMSTDIAYAACPAINTIYVIRTDKNWVCNSFGINGHPSCISATANQATNRLYILSPTRAEIDVVELLTNFIVNTFQIPMTSNPANMIISKDEQWAYILDNQEDYLLQINLSSGELEKRIQLGFQP
ncbi:MAG: hypothetical protein OEL55_06025, partial [Desulfobulbaceae bacterium]|nr:hypothetical protein [Desulfobulbaceae bacterium]